MLNEYIYSLNGTTVFFATFGMDGETGNSPLQVQSTWTVCALKRTDSMSWYRTTARTKSPIGSEILPHPLTLPSPALAMTCTPLPFSFSMYYRTILTYARCCPGRTVYVSWNGATEVTSYAYFSGPSASNLTGQFNVTRSGFETSWNDNSTSPAYVRVAAVAADGTVLGWTNTTAVDA